MLFFSCWSSSKQATQLHILLKCTRYSDSATACLQCGTALCAAAVQAVWVSDCVLGARSPETRAAFISQLQQVSVEASPEDVQWLVSRPAGSAEAYSGPQLFKGQPVPLTAPAAAPDARRALRTTTDSSSQPMSPGYACLSWLILLLRALVDACCNSICPLSQLFGGAFACVCEWQLSSCQEAGHMCLR